ncbi:MAG: hypothetical protein HC896_13235 [Bacteroidales bacterium]|nr:hypothetical protein [Bacteroidales bacterium]
MFEFHGHNDFGMATANAIMAMQAGCQTVSATVNGLGERAGNAALEEITMGLKHTTDLGGHYNTTVLNLLCHTVAKISNRPLHAAKPIVGEKAFTHETGIHVNSQLRNKRSYQPFDAAEVGAEEPGIVYGKHSGKASLAWLLYQQGIYMKGFEVTLLVKRVKEKAFLLKRNLTKQEVLDLVAQSLHAVYTGS